MCAPAPVAIVFMILLELVSITSTFPPFILATQTSPAVLVVTKHIMEKKKAVKIEPKKRENGCWFFLQRLLELSLVD